MCSTPSRLPPLYGGRAQGAEGCPGDEVTSPSDAGIHSERETGHGVRKAARAARACAARSDEALPP